MACSLVAALGLLAAGCFGDIGQPTEVIIFQDAGPVDAAGDAQSEAGAVVGVPAPGSLGASCTANTQCTSKACFMGGMASYCSLPCTSTNAATVCAVAPFDGVCNMQGFCRRP